MRASNPRFPKPGPFIFDLQPTNTYRKPSQFYPIQSVASQYTSEVQICFHSGSSAAEPAEDHQVAEVDVTSIAMWHNARGTQRFSKQSLSRLGRAGGKACINVRLTKTQEICNKSAYYAHSLLEGSASMPHGA